MTKPTGVKTRRQAEMDSQQVSPDEPASGQEQFGETGQQPAGAAAAADQQRHGEELQQPASPAAAGAEEPAVTAADTGNEEQLGVETQEDGAAAAAVGGREAVQLGDEVKQPAVTAAAVTSEPGQPDKTKQQLVAAQNKQQQQAPVTSAAGQDSCNMTALMQMMQSLNQKLDKKFDEQSQLQVQQVQQLDAKMDRQAEEQKAIWAGIKADITGLDQKIEHEVSRLDRKTEHLQATLTEDFSTRLDQTSQDLRREMETFMKPRQEKAMYQLSAAAETFVPQAQAQAVSPPQCNQKIPRFNGKVSWDAYLAQFQIMANANHWTDSQKAYALSTSLEDRAVEVLANIPETDRSDFTKLVTKLETRFGTGHKQQQSQALLSVLRRKKNEPIPELVERISWHVRIANPEASGEVQDIMVLQCLQRAVDDRMQDELVRRGARTLQEVVQVLTTEEALRERRMLQHSATVRGIDASDEERHLNQISPEARRSYDRSTVTRRTTVSFECWHCHKKGHRRANCPELKPEEEKRTARGPEDHQEN